MKTRGLLFAVLLLTGMTVPVLAQNDTGHSRHGNAFDSGLRQRPWQIEGIGKTHFAITSKVPEVQMWFDQGNTLLHSFWYEEAERSFRWCLKLDPDCAMAYWGLSLAAQGERADEFLKAAVQRKASVSPRERMYIEAWETAATLEGKEAGVELAKRLQQIALQYPDDVEAKLLYALNLSGPENTLGIEAVLEQVLAKEPDHPGAHHYRIHNFDNIAPEQAILSCQKYGTIAPKIGHATHMPGHIYSKVGMWHEAARAMDTATRVELRYMNDRLALPFETWNFAHNRNYLCYIQEQLGREHASLQGARDLIAAPRDPDRNKDEGNGASGQGITALVRSLIKFERWETILKPGSIPWRDTPADNDTRAFAETLAYIGQNKLGDAQERLKSLRSSLREQTAKSKENKTPPWSAMLADIAEGQLRAAEGNILEATRLLTQADTQEQQLRKSRQFPNDPPNTAWPVMRVLGDVYLKSGENRLAVAAYERALALEPNDAFALSGLAQAHVALGNRAKAQPYYGRLLTVWAGADPGLRWRKAADALGLDATPVSETPAPERAYNPEELASLGPSNWEPFAAPKLNCLDTNGKPVSLESFRGKNVLLVFYLGEECVHCVEQMVAINARAESLTKENTVVLAVSSATPQTNKTAKKVGNLGIQLLSDTKHENARRFASYDDFEDIELHSTILIDKAGRVRWKRTGGEPFQNIDFLMQTVKRMNEKPIVPENLNANGK